jgi:beta-glucuronidase
MNSKDTCNFQECIHEVGYENIYYSKMISSNSLICDYYREKESLNGDWNFGIDQYDNCLRSKWYEEKYYDKDGRQYPVDFSFDTWERMKVPSCWNMHAEKYFLYEGSVVYTRMFKYKNKGEKRVFIKFGAVNYEAKVFLNKQFVGMHKGGSTPFYIEVTDLLEEANRILVVANNTRKRTNVPCENTDWFNYGGIYRDVEIIRLPETFIKDFSINLMPGTDYKKIQAFIKVDGKQKDGKAVLQIKELGIETEVEIETEIEIKNGYGSVVLDAGLKLWSPKNPRLYDVTVTYNDDVLKEKVGFREIKVEGTEIFLNGQKIFLKGICAHEESVKNGKSVTEEEIRENYRIAKEMNCNFMRLAHYPHSEKAARIADEMGIMLWEEIPVYWAIEFGNKDTYQDAENQLEELIIRDRNRAGVIIWSVGNENADSDERLRFMSSLAKKAKELDPTRLISAACLIDMVTLKIADRLAEYVDVIGINEYYGWYEPDFSKLVRIFENSKPSKPIVITEFGADAKTGARGTKDDLYTEDGQAEVYKKQISTLSRIPYIKGMSPWILFDFRCPRRLHTMQNYYNLKGLLSADKSYKKLAFYIMQKFYRSYE